MKPKQSAKFKAVGKPEKPIATQPKKVRATTKNASPKKSKRVRGGKPVATSKPSNSEPWEPVVAMMAELIPWTADGPVDGIPGHWHEQEESEFSKWWKALHDTVQGVYFTRNGKVWGVNGPQYHSPEGQAFDANAPADWVPVVCCRPYAMNIVIKPPGLNRHPSGAIPGHWTEKAKAAINEWHKTAPWVPEVGFMNNRNAVGIIPPTNGKPENWEELGKPVWREHLEQEKREDAEYEVEAKERAKLAQLEDDGLGWLSPKHDRNFEKAGIGLDGRRAWEFMQQHELGGVEGLLRAFYCLIENPKWPNSGWSRETFFKALEAAFTSSHSLIQNLYAYQNSGDLKHEVMVKEWAGGVLAKHYAETVKGWEQWQTWTDDPTTKKKGGKLRFFAKAMAGKVAQPDGTTKPFSPLGEDWFRSRFNAFRDELHGYELLRNFAEACVNHAGYLEQTETSRKRAATYRQYDERRKAAELKGESRHLIMTPEESAIMGASDLGESRTLPRMSETDFSQAWDRGLKDVRRLKSQFRAKAPDVSRLSKAQFAEGLSDGATPGKLPIKWVMAMKFSELVAAYEQDGRSAPKFLQEKSSALMKMVRPMFGLPAVRKRDQRSG